MTTTATQAGIGAGGGAGTLLVTRAARLRSCWHPVAFAREVTTAAPVARRLLGTDVVLWRTPDGSLHAALDRCPHRWAPLSAGARVDDRLVCPYHGWSFDGDGRAVGVPQLDPATPVPPSWRLAALPVVERLGMAWTSLDPDPSPAVADVPEFADPAFQVIEIGVIRYAAAAPAIVDNNTDATHVAFVHAGTFGRDQDPRVPVGRVGRTTYGVEIMADEMGVAESPGAAAQGARRTATQMWLPFTQVSRLTYSDGATHILLKGLCPVDDAATDVHLTVLRRDPGAPADPQRVRVFELAIEDEDRRMLERLPAEFALDPGRQAHLPHDRAGVAYRRALADLLAGPAGG